jgi:proteasome lid subunit RPN8/RPN11
MLVSIKQLQIAQIEKFHEQCAILTGQHRGHIWYGRLRQFQSGEPASVEFDWAWVLKREEHYGDVLGFYHTHPAGLTTPSGRDVRTMHAWVSCLGKSLICVIESNSNVTAYIFETDEDDGSPLAEIQRFPRNVIVGVNLIRDT